MSAAVVLRARDHVQGELALDQVAPDRFATLSELEIAHLPAWQGRRMLRLGDVFDVRGGRAPELRVQGELADAEGIGADMASGALIVEGHGGRRLGAGMRGGTIVVDGSVGDDLGVGMRGGAVTVSGAAGDRVGGAPPGAAKGMTGGEIVVRGSVGAEAGGRVRRGLVVVLGNAAGRVAEGMIAGTTIVFGSIGAGAAFGLKRGTLVVMREASVPLTFRQSCTYRPPYLALVLTYLNRKYGLAVDALRVHGSYRRWTGDHAELGRGEILQWTGR